MAKKGEEVRVPESRPGKASFFLQLVRGFTERKDPRGARVALGAAGEDLLLSHPKREILMAAGSGDEAWVARTKEGLEVQASTGQGLAKAEIRETTVADAATLIFSNLMEAGKDPDTAWEKTCRLLGIACLDTEPELEEQIIRDLDRMIS